ncbi:MAG: guanine deaminase [Steroidobacteraceae bacterium]
MLRDVLIVVAADGRITAIYRPDTPDARNVRECFAAKRNLVTLSSGQYLLPGFVDLHAHAPQWPQLGKALDLPLEQWLQAHTFPLEARFADVCYAETVYESLVDNLLANGTTTAVYFATLHLPATRILANVCLRRAQRALIGRVAMDDPGQCPPYYRDTSAESAEAATRAFIEHVQSMPGNGAGTIRPVITPRFVPACSDDLLWRLGRIAQETGCHVQTHCSESDWEHQFVLNRCGCTDTAALDKFGLLSRRTILAHGVFVSDADLDVIAKTGTGIAHCPLSNLYLSDAVFPLRRVLQHGVHVGIGSDIAGGASPSILENARQAVISSRTLECGVDAAQPRERRRHPGARVDAITTFWLATAGGGIALDLPIGMFREGYQFDAVVIDGNALGSNLKFDTHDTPDEVLQKITYHGSRTNIRDVWVANRRVYTMQGANGLA